MTQVCEGLAEAHAAGLIHRDLKPAKLFAAHVGRRYDVAKFLDFGLVKEMARRPGGGGGEEGVLGTPLFMAAEQRSGEPALDHRADLFAVGAVAYYLLTEPSLHVKNAIRPLMAPGPEWPIPPSTPSRRPWGSGAGGARCLAKAPADRYPDAGSLRDALAACASASEWDSRKAMQWWQRIEFECQKPYT